MTYIMYILNVGLQQRNVSCGIHEPTHKSWMLELPWMHRWGQLMRSVEPAVHLEWNWNECVFRERRYVLLCYWYWLTVSCSCCALYMWAGVPVFRLLSLLVYYSLGRLNDCVTKMNPDSAGSLDREPSSISSLDEQRSTQTIVVFHIVKLQSQCLRNIKTKLFCTTLHVSAGNLLKNGWLSCELAWFIRAVHTQYIAVLNTFQLSSGN